jgi:hypothetical protein
VLVASSDELLAELRSVGLNEVASAIEARTSNREARRRMARAALNAKGDPGRAAKRAWEDWLAEPPTPGDLTEAFDKRHAR